MINAPYPLLFVAMILAYLFFYHFSRQPSLFLRSSHRPLSLQPLSPPPQQSLCGVRSFLAPPGRWKSSARRERKKRAGGEGDCGERTASIRALEVSRAAKWAPRKGAPKGEAEEEEEEEEEKKKKKKKMMMMMMMMKTRTKKRRGRAEGYTTPSSLAFYFSHPSPHPPVCRQSSSSLGLPLRCYHRGYSSATNVRSCFPSRCSNPRTRLFQGYAETERLFSTCSICRTLESRDT